MRHLLIPFALLAVTACKEEVAQDIAPLPLSSDAIGHFCQMDLLEHDGPKAQAHLAGLPATPLFFSQVRDAVAYQRLPEQSHEILAIWVSDMGADHATWSAPGKTNWIRAKDAVFVVGAQVTGGMGAPEIVPFSDPQQALAFVDANGGRVMRLEDIPDDAVLAPVVLDNDDDDTSYEDRLRALSRNLGE